MGIYFSQNRLLKKTFFSPLNDLDIFVNNDLTAYIKIYFWVLDSFPLVYISVFMLATNYFDDCSFVLSFEIRKCRSPTLFFLFKVVLGVQGPVRLHMNFRMDFSLSVKRVIGILIGNALDLYITLGTMEILTT